jgi:hypothetical protein
VTVWVSPLPESLPIEPGSEASVEVTVRNDSEIVDEYALQVLGETAAWATVEPGSVRLMPGTSAPARVTFRPPRESTLATGARPIGLKVSSIERPDTSTVVEGALEIGAFDALGLDLFPRTSHGSGGGKHEVSLDNRGNQRLQVQLSASDPDGLLRFRFNPPVLDSDPGTATFARLRVRHRRRFLRGPARMRPFTVFAEREGAEPVSATGTAVQEQLLPTWMLGGLVGLAALALLWAFFLKPQVQDTAKNAANSQVLKVIGPTGTTPTGTNGSGSGSGGSGSGGQNGGGSGSGSGGQNGSGSGTSGGSGTSSKPAGPPFSTRLQVSCGATCTSDFKVPDKKTLAVTDIVLGNPKNAKGTLTVRDNNTVLLVENLDNFRDLDFHFGTPISIPSGHQLVIAAKCAGEPCSGAALFSGTLG